MGTEDPGEAFAEATRILLARKVSMRADLQRPLLVRALRVVWPHLADVARRFGEKKEMTQLRAAVPDPSHLVTHVASFSPRKLATFSANLVLVARKLRNGGPAPKGRRSGKQSAQRS
ncbi:MAG: hypothetical protein JNK78_20145 [Planctomycetes bacterium]|nr:hypothetical protein [Planctomycetota bacterium]